MRPDIRGPSIRVADAADARSPAIAAERLGIGTIRGSGDHGSAFHRKGGVGAFREMLQALEDDWNVATTADVPKRARVVGLGIIIAFFRNRQSIDVDEASILKN